MQTQIRALPLKLSRKRYVITLKYINLFWQYEPFGGNNEKKDTDLNRI